MSEVGEKGVRKWVFRAKTGPISRGRHEITRLRDLSTRLVELGRAEKLSGSWFVSLSHGADRPTLHRSRRDRCVTRRAMSEGGAVMNQEDNGDPQKRADHSNTSPTVLLLVGPGGAGKTSMGQRIGSEPGWCHIAEDKVWDELPRDPFSARTDEEKSDVQRRVVQLISDRVSMGVSVVLDFILYEIPPQPILFYQAEITKLKVEVVTRVLCPRVEIILERQAARANSHDTEVAVAERRRNAEHQVRCARSEYIDPAWVLDSSNLSLDELYARYFAAIVAKRR